MRISDLEFRRVLFRSERFQVLRQHVFREAGLLLVEVHRGQRERHRRLFLQLQQDVEQGVAVLAAGQADHDLVAVIDHAEVADRATDLVEIGSASWREGVCQYVENSGGAVSLKKKKKH